MKAMVNRRKLGDVTLQAVFSKTTKVRQLQRVISFDAGRINRQQLREAQRGTIDKPGIEVVYRQAQGTAESFVPNRFRCLRVKQLSVVLGGAGMKPLGLFTDRRNQPCRPRVDA